MTGWTSPMHIVLLLLIALLLFGAKRLPEIGRSLGSGMREFKDSVTHQSTNPESGQQLPPLTGAANGVEPTPGNDRGASTLP